MECVLYFYMEQLNRDVFRAGCNSRPAVKSATQIFLVESVQLRYRQYSLDERRCVVFFRAAPMKSQHLKGMDFQVFTFS